MAGARQEVGPALKIGYYRVAMLEDSIIKFYAQIPTPVRLLTLGICNPYKGFMNSRELLSTVEYLMALSATGGSNREVVGYSVAYRGIEELCAEAEKRRGQHYRTPQNSDHC